MVYRCAVFGCGNTNSDNVSVFKCPDKVKRSWARFIKRTRAKWSSNNIHICSSHFTQDQFQNWTAVEFGFHSKLLIKKDAVPTIYPTLYKTKVEVAKSTATGASCTATDTETISQSPDSPQSNENASSCPNKNSGTPKDSIFETPKLVRSAYRKREVQRVSKVHYITTLYVYTSLY